MKLNWGNSLLLFFIFYVGILMVVLFKSFGIKQELVMDNYYEHDLQFQKRLDQISNRKTLEKDLQIYFDNDEKIVKLDFGNQQNLASAEVNFYNAADKSADRKKELSLVDSEQIVDVPIPDLKPGKYDIQVTWNDDQKSYYKEQFFLYQQ